MMINHVTFHPRYGNQVQAEKNTFSGCSTVSSLGANLLLTHPWSVQTISVRIMHSLAPLPSQCEIWSTSERRGIYKLIFSKTEVCIFNNTSHHTLLFFLPTKSECVRDCRLSQCQNSDNMVWMRCFIQYQNVSGESHETNIMAVKWNIKDGSK